MSQTERATRQHAPTGPALPQPAEPTHAERVRTLLSLVPVATLSTLSRKHSGFPFGSLMKRIAVVAEESGEVPRF
jgi:heme iron utilization protein